MVRKTVKKRTFEFLFLAMRIPSQPPVDSQRANAPVKEKKTDRENINSRAQGVMSKVKVMGRGKNQGFPYVIPSDSIKGIS